MQLSIEEYLKECWKNKQEVIDVSAYKLNEEELNKVIFGIHYENPEYYWVLRNTAINKDEETGFVKTYYQYYEGTTGKPLDRSEELEREWEVVKEKTKYCKTDIEKALVVHEHLCDTIVYSPDCRRRLMTLKAQFLRKKLCARDMRLRINII